MKNKELSRRAAIARLGALAGAAYLVPSVTTLSAAYASSDSSESSASSVSSVSSVSSASSVSSTASRPSSATGDATIDGCATSSTTDAEFTQCLIDAGVDPSTI